MKTYDKLSSPSTRIPVHVSFLNSKVRVHRMTQTLAGDLDIIGIAKCPGSTDSKCAIAMTL